MSATIESIVSSSSRTQGECVYIHERFTVSSVHQNNYQEETSDWGECEQCRQFLENVDYVGTGNSSLNFTEDQWDDAPTFYSPNVAVATELST